MSVEIQKVFGELIKDFEGRSFLVKAGHERAGEIVDFVEFEKHFGVTVMFVKSKKDGKVFFVRHHTELYKIERKLGADEYRG